MTLLLHPVELFSTIPVACYVRSVQAFALHQPHRQSRRSELLLYTAHTDNPDAPSFCFTPLPTTPSRTPLHRHRSRSLPIHHRNSPPYYTYDDNSYRAPHPTTCGRASSHPHHLSTHHFSATTPTCPHTLPTPPSLDLHQPQRNSRHPASLFCTYPLGLSSFRGLDLHKFRQPEPLFNSYYTANGITGTDIAFALSIAGVLPHYTYTEFSYTAPHPTKCGRASDQPHHFSVKTPTRPPTYPTS